MSDTDGKVVTLPVRRRYLRNMTKDQKEWYWAGRIDALIDEMGHTPVWGASAGKRPGTTETAEVVTLRKRKPKPAG
ncbi:hypothetical protein [Acidisphaera sp. S103]|uniref:hypothetical protein n=1 Tax=Acidisphaera sp. S103 TaxID=1747223 RepID=UPI00131B9E0D|nr:hypothetical protein [Acidisphaera sp. S103]